MVMHSYAKIHQLFALPAVMFHAVMVLASLAVRYTVQEEHAITTPYLYHIWYQSSPFHTGRRLSCFLQCCKFRECTRAYSVEPLQSQAGTGHVSIDEGNGLLMSYTCTRIACQNPVKVLILQDRLQGCPQLSAPQA